MADKRLLVVDDVPEICEVVRLVGDGLGFEVETATNGHEFMRTLEDFHPTTVLIDIVMPGVDGFDLVRWLGDRRSDARVIIASGVNPEYAKLAAKLADANGLEAIWIQKPFLVDELSRALTETQERSSPSVNVSPR